MNTNEKPTEAGNHQLSDADKSELLDEYKGTSDTFTTPQEVELSQVYEIGGSKTSKVVMQVPVVATRTLAKRKLLKDRKKDKYGNPNFDEEDIIKGMIMNLCKMNEYELEKLTYADYNTLAETLAGFFPSPTTD